MFRESLSLDASQLASQHKKSCENSMKFCFEGFCATYAAWLLAQTAAN